MTINEISEMLTKRLVNLQSLKTSAESLGDISRVAALEADIAETQATLDRLTSLNA